MRPLDSWVNPFPILTMSSGERFVREIYLRRYSKWCPSRTPDSFPVAQRFPCADTFSRYYY